MNISEYCFSDTEIISYIKSQGIIGCCDITCHTEIPVVKIENAEVIKECFRNIIEAYTEKKFLQGLPPNFIKSRRDVLIYDWNLFSEELNANQMDLVLSKIFSDFLNDNNDFLNEKVGLEELGNKNYLAEHAILNINWIDFVNVLKFKNRYWPERYINKNNLTRILSVFSHTIKKGAIFYRARITEKNKVYGIKEIGAPPKGCSSEGRLNPQGISRLYLSDSIETTIHEIRASEYDNVCIGKFSLTRDINVIDLRQIDVGSLSKFVNIMPVADAVMVKDFLRHINEEMAHPLRRNDDRLDYVSTQFIADFIESMENIDGIVYRSTMCIDGFNLLLYNVEDAKCIGNPSFYKIKRITFESEIL